MSQVEFAFFTRPVLGETVPGIPTPTLARSAAPAFAAAAPIFAAASCSKADTMSRRAPTVSS